MKKAGIPIDVMEVMKRIKQLKIKLEQLLSENQKLHYLVILAEVYKDLPIYFSTKCDYRGRMYP
jgi:DNA-directed RNA polymerase